MIVSRGATGRRWWSGWRWPRDRGGRLAWPDAGTTARGAFLDPLANKAVVSGHCSAARRPPPPVWPPVALIAVREVTLVAYRSVGGAPGVSSSRPGPRPRLKTLVQDLASHLLIPPAGPPRNTPPAGNHLGGDRPHPVPRSPVPQRRSPGLREGRRVRVESLPSAPELLPGPDRRHQLGSWLVSNCRRAGSIALPPGGRDNHDRILLARARRLARGRRGSSSCGGLGPPATTSPGGDRRLSYERPLVPATRRSAAQSTPPFFVARAGPCRKTRPAGRRPRAASVIDRCRGRHRVDLSGGRQVLYAVPARPLRDGRDVRGGIRPPAARCRGRGGGGDRERGCFAHLGSQRAAPGRGAAGSGSTRWTPGGPRHRPIAFWPAASRASRSVTARPAPRTRLVGLPTPRRGRPQPPLAARPRRHRLRPRTKRRWSRRPPPGRPGLRLGLPSR